MMKITKSQILSSIKTIDHGFFDRTGGCSSGYFESLNVGIGRGDDENAVKNREQIAKYYDLSLSNLIILRQTHSDLVHLITKTNIPKYSFTSVEQALLNEGDALVTNVPNILIGVNTADCAPILICDREQKYIGAIHAGWRGAVGNIIENTCETLANLGCRNLVAAVGPCIHTLKLQSSDVPEQYWDCFYEQEGVTYFDLPGLVRMKLEAGGIKEIEVIDIDTRINENYFSFRRMQGKNGVQFSGIYIKE